MFVHVEAGVTLPGLCSSMLKCTAMLCKKYPETWVAHKSFLMVACFFNNHLCSPLWLCHWSFSTLLLYAQVQHVLQVLKAPVLFLGQQIVLLI